MDWNVVLAALRDFFAASDGQALLIALVDLNQASRGGAAVPFNTPAADDLEFAFNRLFVGPGPVSAPPYASVYLDPDRRLMGAATRRAAAVYDALGLSSPLSGSLPDDHLALELDAALAFRTLAARRQDDQVDALWRYFLHDHMAHWLPKFAAAVAGAADVAPAIGFAVGLLSQWLAEETKSTPPNVDQSGGLA
jgi:TorA maturation chaperone TorD